MIRAHTVAQVRAAEAALLAELPDGALMQRAAAGLAAAIADYLGFVYGRRVLLLVGSGDNGGDALFAGAMLARRGAAVEAWLLADRVHEAGLAALLAAGGVTYRDADAHYDLVVDGIVGIGGRPGLRPDAAAAVAAVRGIPTVAVDVPSGVGVDTGELDGPHVVADLTVTFGTHKVAHLVDPAAAASGALHRVDIGLDLPPADIEALQPADVAALLPTPGRDAQKYSRGVVGVRAGSAIYPGAAMLSVSGAACGLAGMVRYVGDRAVMGLIHTQHPEVVGAGRVQAWVVGSGSDHHAAEQLAAALADDVPLVIDADALARLDGHDLSSAVLTPHAGELARMIGVERADVEARPLAHTRAAARDLGCVVLLKGPHTLIADPSGHTRVTTTGTPWLATAGAGDVLGGLIGALLAAGLTPYDAASVGAWLHGRAGTLATRTGPIVASDVARNLPRVIGALHGLVGGSQP